MPRDSEAPARLRPLIYRQARLWHGWLSAAAFLVLMFFAGSGLLLNNEDWFKTEPRASSRTVPLTQAERAAPDPRAAAAQVASRLGLKGEPAKPRPGDRSGGYKLRSPGSAVEIRTDTASGVATVRTETFGAAEVLRNLHKGKVAGPVWRLLIDAAAVVVLLLSLLGYTLFFSLRFRLRTGLILTGATVAVVTAALVFFVP